MCEQHTCTKQLRAQCAQFTVTLLSTSNTFNHKSDYSKSNKLTIMSHLT